ncbi:DTW domain-containing protein [Marinomonas sp. 15G1-11]|uniref:tRNA-uridine aminocarboxypropyltransferase n=1 Tax=Marinomonas phaeophyticola TaxID=3004091 RepID=A0ABT4JQE7_9GAMM|nr:tRNA-uridine aminocarboxypropyltransferase [Marinomonas sp. 15G1-11]MCZ2720592.1 DTW domain-containing protein [Marinomonas sp. 15G1-11]
MRITLLTHLRELNKCTATGPLVKQVLSTHCNIIEWRRKEPNKELMSLDPSTTALVFPVIETATWPISRLTETELPGIHHFIILDGTWQEAQKMYHKSPYLHSLPHYELNTEYQSEYRLRRNQKAVGLCTAEVAIEILKRKGLNKESGALYQRFTHFNT